MNETTGTGHKRSVPLFVISKLADVINLTGVVIVFATVTTMFLAIFINVVLRYVFASGITWAYEIHNLLLPWLVAGGAVMAACAGRNISVDIIIKVLPDSLSRLFGLAVNAFVAAVCVGVVYSSLPIVRAAQYSRLAETGIPQMYGYMSLLYAFSMIAVIAILQIVQTLLGDRTAKFDPAASSFS